jgi:hypothetical protein
MKRLRNIHPGEVLLEEFLKPNSALSRWRLTTDGLLPGVRPLIPHPSVLPPGIPPVGPVNQVASVRVTFAMGMLAEALIWRLGHGLALSTGRNVATSRGTGVK